MKFLTLLSLIVIFIALVSPVKSDSTLLVFGDPGHINYYEEVNPKMDKPDPESDEKMDLLNFKEVINMDIAGKKYGCNADGIVILGDMVYTEGSYIKLKTDDSSKLPAFKKRLTKAWQLFKGSIDYYAGQCQKIQKSPFNLKTTNGKYKKLTLLAGNHMFDVDYMSEAKSMADIVTNEGYFWKKATTGTNYLSARKDESSAEDLYLSPRMEHVVEGSTPIVSYLDVNLLPVTCFLLTKQNPAIKYEECYFKKTAYPTFPDEAAAKELTDKLIQAFKDLAELKAPWKVLRLHHPFMNIEGGSNNFDNVWKIQVDGTDTLLDLAQKAKIAIVMASHHHSAQLMAFPYKQSGNYNSIPLSVDVPKPKPSDSKCYQNTKLIGSDVNPCTGADDLKKTISININTTAPKHMWTFVIGNSGRKVDPVWFDKYMPASLIWARNNFGGANFVFNTNGTIQVTYFATVGGKQETTLIVNIKKIDTPDKSDTYDSIKTKANLTSYTKKLRNRLKK